jgi:hypothetical protein
MRGTSVILASFKPGEKQLSRRATCGLATYAGGLVSILSRGIKRALNGGIGP